MLTRFLKKFRKRFLIVDNQDSPGYLLLDLKAQKVIELSWFNRKMMSRRRCIETALFIVIGPFNTLDFIIERRRRDELRRFNRIKKSL